MLLLSGKRWLGSFDAGGVMVIVHSLPSSESVREKKTFTRAEPSAAKSWKLFVLTVESAIGSVKTIRTDESGETSMELSVGEMLTTAGGVASRRTSPIGTIFDASA